MGSVGWLIFISFCFILYLNIHIYRARGGERTNIVQSFFADLDLQGRFSFRS